MPSPRRPTESDPTGSRRWSLVWRLISGLAAATALCAFQKPFHQYPGVEYTSFELTPDWQEKTEWAFARLMFPPGWNDGYRGRFDGDWRQGLSLWTQDYPRADRHFSQALRRLSRIHGRSVEQPINLDEAERVRLPKKLKPLCRHIFLGFPAIWIACTRLRKSINYA